MADDSDAPTVYEKPTKNPMNTEQVPDQVPIIPDWTKVYDSPELTHSLSTSSSASRKTYNVPTYVESEIDESSESNVLIQKLKDPDETSTDENNIHPKLRRMATLPSEIGIMDDCDADYDEPVFQERPVAAEYAAEQEATTEAEYAAEQEATTEAEYAAEQEATTEAEYAAEQEATTEAEYPAEQEATTEAEYAVEYEATTNSVIIDARSSERQIGSDAYNSGFAPCAESEDDNLSNDEIQKDMGIHPDMC